MKAKEFNSLFEKYVNDNLEEFGFKKSGVHFYIYKSPNILVLHKKTYRDIFEGYFLGFTHDFFSYCKNSKGKLKIPSSLLEIPVSIRVDEIYEQYKENKTMKEFEYDMYIRRREGFNRNNFDLFNNIIENEESAEEYIKNTVMIVKKYAKRMFEEFNYDLTYSVLNKEIESREWWEVKRYISEIEDFKRQF